MDDKYLEALYGQLSSTHDLGSIESFKQQMNDPKYREALFQDAGHALDLGSYNDFETALKKKSQGDTASSVVSPDSSTGTVIPTTIKTDGSPDFTSINDPNNPDPFTPKPITIGKPLTRQDVVNHAFQNKAIIDQYAANPNSDPAIVKSLSKTVKEPEKPARYSFGENEPDWLKKADDWANENIVNPILRPAEAFVYNHAFLPVYQGSAGLVNKTVAGATDFLNDAGKISGMHVIPDGLRNYLDSITEMDKNMKPIGDGKDGLAGDIVSGVTGTLPLVAALPEVGAESAAETIPKLLDNNIYLKTAYKAITAPIVKLFAVTGAAGAYHDSAAAGNDIATNTGAAIEGGVENAEEGLKMEAQTLVGGAFGKNVANQLGEKGLLIGGKPTVALLHALAIGTVFGGTSAAEGLINKEDPDAIQNEAIKQFAVGAAFGVPEVVHSVVENVENSKANKNIVKTGYLANSVQDMNNTAIVSNLMGFDMDAIHQINATPVSPDQLYAASLQVGSKAYEETDPEAKRNLMLQQISLKNQGDIKRATQTIVNDPVKFSHSIVNSDLPSEDKLNLLTKITDINKAYNPVEIEKTNLNETISTLNDGIQQSQDAIAATTDQGEKSNHYVSLNDQIGQRVAAQNRLFDINTAQQEKAERQSKINELEDQRNIAHKYVGQEDDSTFSGTSDGLVHDASNHLFTGDSPDDIHRQIDDHIDQRISELNSPAEEKASGPPAAAPEETTAPAAAAEENKTEEPAAATEPTDIKPYLISNNTIGDAHIIDYKPDGSITLKMTDGTEEEVPKQDQAVLGISNTDVEAFKKENNFADLPPSDNGEAPSLQERINNLGQRIYGGDQEFSDEDVKLHTNFPDQVSAAVERHARAAAGEVNASISVPGEGQRAEAKDQYRSELEGELDKLRTAQREVTQTERKTEKNTTRPLKNPNDWMKKLLSPFTPERVTEAKSNLVEMQRRYRENKKILQSGLPLERGANFLQEKLSRAARNNHISQEGADLAIDLVRSNPDLFKDLAISITHAGDHNSTAQGWYHSGDAIIKILKGSSELTATHELLHHTERFLPEEVRGKILKEWHDQVQRQKKTLLGELKNEQDPDRRYKITTALQYLGIAEQKQLEPNRENANDMDRIMKKYLKDDLGQSFYQLHDPSEWWAVNASKRFREMQNKPEATGWLEKAKEWYSGFTKSIKNVLGLNATQNVERGLKTILRGDVLNEMKGTQLSGAKRLFNLEPPERPVREPGEPLRDYTQRVRDFLDKQKQDEGAAIPPAGEPPVSVEPEHHHPADWEVDPETKTEKFSRKFQDYLNRAEKVQKTIEQAGGRINEGNDFHTAADLQGAKAKQLQNELYERMIKSPDKNNPAFFERLQKDGLSKKDLDDYLRAMHVEEYNREVGKRRRQAYESEIQRLETNRQEASKKNNHESEAYYERQIKKMQDQKVDRYPLMDDGASGMTNKEAQNILDNFREEGKIDDLKKYGDEFVKEVSNRQLDVQLETGTIDQDTHDMLKKRYENYVPFHVEDFLEPKDGRILKRNVASTGSRVDNIIRRAKGSVERTADQRVSPSTYGIVQLEKSYIEGEKNKTFNKLYDQVEQNPNNPYWEIVHPQYAPTLRKDGTVSGFREVTDHNIVKNAVQLYRDGRKEYIHIKDPLLLRAVKREGIVKTIAALDHVTNYLRAVSTVFSPEFWVTNSLKHVQLGAINLSADGQKDIALSMAKNSFPAMKAMFDYEHGKRDSEWTPYVERYLQAGGRLSGVAPGTDIEKIRSIEKVVADIGKKKNLVQNTKAFVHYVSTIGEASGIGPRLAMFRAAADKGLSDQQAAALSREATINFNKKGEWSGIMGNFYLMFNAGMQGKLYLAKQLYKSPTARKIYGGFFAAGLMAAAMNHANSNQDDDPITEYDKQNNFILKNPFGKGNIQFPIGFGYNLPYYLGTKFYETAMGLAKPGQAGMDVLGAAVNAYSPVAHADLLQTLVPTEPGRWLTQYTENKNNFGSPVYKDADKYGVQQPSSHVHFSKTPAEFVAMAQGLNHLTGGTGVQSGKLDFSPDVMQWMYQTATGGLGTMAQDAAHTAVNGSEHAAQQLGFMPSNVKLSPMEVKSIPFLRKFYTEGLPVNYKSVIFSTLDKSGDHEIDNGGTNDFFNALMSAAMKGQINMKEYKQYSEKFIQNQVRISIGQQYPDMEKNDIEPMMKKHKLIK